MHSYNIAPLNPQRKWQDATIEKFKAFCHINPSEFDESLAIQMALDTATDLWEKHTDQATESTTYIQTQDNVYYHKRGPVGIIYLMRFPYISCASVVVTKSDNTTTTLTLNTDYTIDSSGRLAAIRFKEPLPFQPPVTITITFTAGLTSILPTVRFAVFSMAKWYFDNRDAFTTGKPIATPGGFLDLASLYRHGRGII